MGPGRTALAWLAAVLCASTQAGAQTVQWANESQAYLEDIGEIRVCATLSEDAARRSTVNIRTAQGTRPAADATDYTLHDTELVFDAGELRACARITVLNDDVVETEEKHAVLELHDADGLTVGGRARTTLELFDEDLTEVRLAPAGVTPEGTSARFGATLTHPFATDWPVRVRVRAAGASPASSEDLVDGFRTYQAQIPALARAFTLPIGTVRDDRVENDETFEVSICVDDYRVTNADCGDDEWVSARATIRNPAPVVLRWEWTERRVEEGNITVTQTLSADRAVPGTGYGVRLYVDDFETVPGTDYRDPGEYLDLQIPPGGTRATASLQVLEDTEAESHESVLLYRSLDTDALDAQGIAVGFAPGHDAASLRLVIANDDHEATVAHAQAYEGTDVAFRIETAGDGFPDPASVRYRVSHLTSEAGDVRTGTFTAQLSADGHGVRRVRVPTARDADGDTDTFRFELLSVTGARVRPQARIATGTIRELAERPKPVLVATPAEVAEAHGTTQVHATLAEPAPEAFAIEIEPADRARLEGGGRLRFASGATRSTNTVRLRGVDNDENEGDVTARARGRTTGTERVQDPDPLALTLLDDDQPAMLAMTLGAASRTEGQTFTVRLALDRALDRDTPVRVWTERAEGDTATPDVDYGRTDRTIVIAAGETAAQTSIASIDDETAEPGDAETFTVVAEAVDGRSVGGGRVRRQARIEEESADLAIELRLDPVEQRVLESAGEIALEITASRIANTAYTAHVGFVSASATSPQDYDAPTSLLPVRMAPGTATTRVGGIEIADDDVTEAAEEQFGTTLLIIPAQQNGLTLSTAPGGGTATVTIVDDDAAVEIADAQVQEGEIMRFAVTANEAGVILPATIRYEVRTGSATTAEHGDVDTGRFTEQWVGGDARRHTIKVRTFADGDTDDETFAVEVLSVTGANGARAPLARATATGRIVEPAGTPALSLDIAEPVAEDAGAVQVRATLDAAATETITARIEVTPDSAHRARGSGTITIEAGDLTAPGHVEVTPIDNDVYDPDEHFVLAVDVIAGRAQRPPDRTVRIANDDPVPDLTFTVRRGETTEGGTTTVVLGLDRASTKTIVVHCTWEPFSATPEAATLLTERVVFAPGDVSAPVQVATHDNDRTAVDDNRKTTGSVGCRAHPAAEVTVSGKPYNALDPPWTAALITIVDDDNIRVGYERTHYEVAEDAGTLHIGYTLSGELEAGHVFGVLERIETGNNAPGFAPPTATQGTDYEPVLQTRLVGNEITSESTELRVLDDTIMEPDEVVIVRRVKQNALPSFSVEEFAQVTILDDDLEAHASVDAIHALEGETASFTVVLPADIGETVSVEYHEVSAERRTSITPERLRFTPENWNVPQTVSVTFRHDPEEADHEVTLRPMLYSARRGVQHGAPVIAHVRDFDADNVGTVDTVRLRHGADERSGRLEVFKRHAFWGSATHPGETVSRWGTVCDDRMAEAGNLAPVAACRMLGYEGGQTMAARNTPELIARSEGYIPVWLDDLRCIAGTHSGATSITQCYHAGTGNANCAHDEDVWLRCTGERTGTGAPRTPIVPEAPAISVASAYANEASGRLRFTITMRPPLAAGGTATVMYETLEASTPHPAFDGGADFTPATENTDYTPRTGMVTFSADDASFVPPGYAHGDADHFRIVQKTFDVPIVDDTVEDSREYLTVRLGNATGATIASGTARGYIYNHEDAVPEAQPRARLHGAPTAHGGDAFTVSLALSEVAVATPAAVEAALGAQGGAVSGVARAADDGNRSWTITVTPEDDGRDVTVTFDPGGDCTGEAAICTEDGRAFGSAPRMTVPALAPGPAAAVTQARVSNGPGPHGTWDAGDIVEATVTWSEAVTVEGTPELAIMLDATQARARYASGSGSASLVFRHTVTDAGAGARHARIAPGGIALEGASIRGPDGRAAQTALATPPWIEAMRVRDEPSGDGLWTEGEAIELEVTFTQAVTITGTGMQASVRVGGFDGTLAYGAQPTLRTVILSEAVTGGRWDRADLVIGADAVSAPPGTVRGTASALDADLRHHALAAHAGTAPAPIVATFSNAPAAHDGAPFTVHLALEPAPAALGYRTLDAALEVHGAEITRVARQRGGDNGAWSLTVEPEGDGPATITLGASPECAASGAICSAAGGRLEAAATLIVAGPAASADDFTVRLDAVPAEHDGSSAVTFEVHFSEEPHQYSFRTLRDETLEILQGGTRIVPSVKRKSKPSNRTWTVTVEPVSKADMTIAIAATTDCEAAGAVCNGDGEPLSEDVEAVVPGPPGLSVADATVTGGRRRDAGLRGDARPRVLGHGDGGLRDLGRHGDPGRGLHGDLGNADLHAGRDRENRLRLRPGRRP